MIRTLVFVAVLAALATSILGGNALLGLLLSPALLTYLIIARRTAVPLARLRAGLPGAALGSPLRRPAKARQRRGGKKRR